MPVHGDLSQLRNLSAKLRLVHEGAHFVAASQTLRGTFVKLAADQFKSESDPYGERWAPLKRERTRNRRARKRGKRGGQKIGQDTGRMRASFVAEVQGRTWTIGYAVDYSKYFHFGRRYQDPRMLVPLPARGLGPIWTAAIARDIKAALEATLTGGR